MNIKTFFGLFALLLSFPSVGQELKYEDYFTPKSLRVDFALSGNAQNQYAAIEQIREEPVWGGQRRNLIDPFGYGRFFVNVYDKRSGEKIFSRGMNTLFEEWISTDEARVESQSWTNSITMPYPKDTIEFEILQRKGLSFEPMLRQIIAPQSIFIDRSELAANRVHKIHDSGEPATKVDLVFLAEGYTKAEQSKFMADARRFVEAMFQEEPFKSREEDFNVWAVELESAHSGVDISGEGVYKRTALNCGYYTFGMERYLTTKDVKSIRDAVWNVPCDAVFLLVNEQKYGGSGMYNLYASGSADNERTIRVFLHEMGHSLAGLADEYFRSDVSYVDFYDKSIEPVEPNITTLVNFERKWKDMLPEGTETPTAVDPANPNKIGVFEGGGYSAKGIYRPVDNCKMRENGEFCPVCSLVINRVIDFVCDK